jgi:hypothetical protein
MHSIIDEIATHIKMIELPPSIQQLETKSFYKNNAVKESQETQEAD